MKKRLVFSVGDMPAARIAMEQARGAGIPDDDISLIARSDKSDMIPDDRKIVEGDFYPAAAKGAVGGAVVGLVAGLVAVAIPPLGITVAGAFAMAAGGSVLGAWSTALAGSAVADPASRKFEGEVQAGRILVVIDGTEDILPRAANAVLETGARQLDFERPTVIT
ncbi:hypothetical protein [Dyella acidiphila]|uniref:DUF1269 domain-containing protein n=1 Tax=Dyella acidiphila TaxID=2775866 RepID=A0ABR9GBU8_9GAMM|nr:hypothetical protein [Dyella acidiphila]MBE1161531.1 hypothetical protein [Dyella acidiphila]